MDEIIITFLSHYDAINFYTKNQTNYDEIKVLPVPRKISSSCGSCVRLISDLTLMDFDLFEYESVYKVVDNNYIKVIDCE